jgi:hypothetical protein
MVDGVYDEMLDFGPVEDLLVCNSIQQTAILLAQAF